MAQSREVAILQVTIPSTTPMSQGLFGEVTNDGMPSTESVYRRIRDGSFDVTVRSLPVTGNDSLFSDDVDEMKTDFGQHPIFVDVATGRIFIDRVKGGSKFRQEQGNLFSAVGRNLPRRPENHVYWVDFESKAVDLGVAAVRTARPDLKEIDLRAALAHGGQIGMKRRDIARSLIEAIRLAAMTRRAVHPTAGRTPGDILTIRDLA